MVVLVTVMLMLVMVLLVAVIVVLVAADRCVGGCDYRVLVALVFYCCFGRSV